MKLLAKTAEERYQSALGRRADSNTAHASGQIEGKSPDFRWASRICLIASSSHSIFGREQQLDALLGAFEQPCQGRSASCYAGLARRR